MLWVLRPRRSLQLEHAGDRRPLGLDHGAPQADEREAQVEEARTDGRARAGGVMETRKKHRVKKIVEAVHYPHGTVYATRWMVVGWPQRFRSERAAKMYAQGLDRRAGFATKGVNVNRKPKKLPKYEVIAGRVVKV